MYGAGRASMRGLLYTAQGLFMLEHHQHRLRRVGLRYGFLVGFAA